MTEPVCRRLAESFKFIIKRNINNHYFHLKIGRTLKSSQDTSLLRIIEKLLSMKVLLLKCIVLVFCADNQS